MDYIYNSQNRLTQNIEENNTNTLVTNMTYDYNGNMISSSTETIEDKQEPEEEASYGMFIMGQDLNDESGEEESYTSYKYNDLNQMVEAIQGDKTSKYSYNGEGYRTKVVSGSSITKYAYIGDKVGFEQNNTEAISNLYTGNKLVTRTINNDTLYYYYNGHGDVIHLYDLDTETVKAEFDYDAFGTVIKDDNVEDINNPFMYSGYQYDEDTELYYLNARMYDAKIARFMQVDTYLGKTSDPLSLNSYSYGYNNPIKYWDPSGHIVTKWDEANLSEDQIRLIDNATNDWIKANKSGDQKSKEAAHARAEAVRNSVRTASEIGSVDGFTHNLSTTSKSVITNIYSGDKGFVGKEDYNKGYRPKEFTSTKNTDINVVVNQKKDTSEIADNIINYPFKNQTINFGSSNNYFHHNSRGRVKTLLIYMILQMICINKD